MPLFCRVFLACRPQTLGADPIIVNPNRSTFLSILRVGGHYFLDSMLDDAQLLQMYAESRSEAAFAELVRRHFDLVYNAATRELGGDQHLARDVAQSVFVLFAGRSRSLQRHASIAGWLHQTTRYTVAHVLREERRRRAREEAAHSMNESENGLDAEWRKIRPIIDSALSEIPEADREAVLLRYFENRPFAEIGARLRCNEKTAHKRVERALDKLRVSLERRGVASTSGALALALGAHAAVAAPAGMSAAVTGSIVASGLPAVAALTLMSTKITTVIATLAVAASSGVVTFQFSRRDAATTELAAVSRENARLQSQLRGIDAKLNERPLSTPAPIQPRKPTEPPSRRSTLDPESLAEGEVLVRSRPEVRDALTAAISAGIRDEYAGLLAAGHLTEAEIERFVALKSVGRGMIVGEHLLFANGSPKDREAATEAARQIQGLLGKERYQSLRAFERDSIPRAITDQVVSETYYTPTAMTPTQVREFRKAVADALADPTTEKRDSSSNWTGVTAPVWDRIIERVAIVGTASTVSAVQGLKQRALFQQAMGAAAAELQKQKEKTK